jgi:hypothetical protein
VFSLGSASRQLRRRRSSVQSASQQDHTDQLARTVPAVQFACSRGTFCKSQCNQEQEQIGEDLSGNQPDQLSLWLHRALLNSTPHRASLSEEQATLPAVFQAATPSADLSYSRPAIAINRRPVTSRATLRAPHNASCVFTERANKSAYHLRQSINCEGIPHTRITRGG